MADSIISAGGQLAKAAQHVAGAVFYVDRISLTEQ
jgi:hypothetical protein